MKVLMLCPQPFFEPRGTPISTYQRLKGLSALGHSVDVLTYHVGEDIEITNVVIHRIPNVPFIKSVKVGPSLAKIPLDILLFIKAFIMLLRGKYEVIHTHEEAAFLALPLAYLFNVRHVYDMHSSLPMQLANFDFANHRPFVKLFEVLERWTLNTCDTVITVSTDLEKHIEQVAPQARQVKIDNLPIQMNGVGEQRAVDNLRQELRLDGRLPIVFTGTFERYQGLDLLVKSAEIVKKHQPEVVFVMVGGKGEQIRALRAKVQMYGLQDDFIFVGTVPLDEAFTYLEVAEILVSPRIEGRSIPLKIYSYLYSGKPTVATNLEMHKQILNENVAILTDPTPVAFADGLLRLISDATLRSQLGQQARAYMCETFPIENYQARLSTIYEVNEPARATTRQELVSISELETP